MTDPQQCIWLWQHHHRFRIFSAPARREGGRKYWGHFIICTRFVSVWLQREEGCRLSRFSEQSPAPLYWSYTSAIRLTWTFHWGRLPQTNPSLSKSPTMGSRKNGHLHLETCLLAGVKPTISTCSNTLMNSLILLSNLYFYAYSGYHFFT